MKRVNYVTNNNKSNFKHILFVKSWQFRVLYGKSVHRLKTTTAIILGIIFTCYKDITVITYSNRLSTYHLLSYVSQTEQLTKTDKLDGGYIKEVYFYCA